MGNNTLTLIQDLINCIQEPKVKLKNNRFEFEPTFIEKEKLLKIITQIEREIPE